MKPDLLTFTPQQIIFNEGEVSNGIYLVQEGIVEVFRIKDGTEILLGLVRAGDVLGTVTLLSKEPRTACARAQTKCQLLFYPSDGIKDEFKNNPIWMQAVVKDAIARLKHVNELLITAKLNEKKLLRTVGSSHHHASQMAYLLASYVRKNTLMNDVNQAIFPTNDFITQAELILMKKYEYLEQIYKAFKDSALIKEVDDKKYGKILMKPSAPLLEDFAVYSLNIAKKGVISFAPQKYYPWMSAIARVSRKNNNEKFKRTELASLVQTDLGREDGEFIISELISHDFIQEKDGLIHTNATRLQKTVVFESLSRILRDIKL